MAAQHDAAEPPPPRSDPMSWREPLTGPTASASTSSSRTHHNAKCTTLCPVLDAWLRGGVPTRGRDRDRGRGWQREDDAVPAAPSRRADARAPRRPRRRVRVRAHGGQGAADAPHAARGKTRKSPRRVRGVRPRPAGSRVRREDAGRPGRAVVRARVDRGGAERPPGRGGATGAPRRDRLEWRRRFARARRAPSTASSRGSGTLSRAAALLKEYAHRHDLAVVVTNHVSDVVSDDDEMGGGGRRRRGGGGDFSRAGVAAAATLRTVRRRRDERAAASRRRWGCCGRTASTRGCSCRGREAGGGATVDGSYPTSGIRRRAAVVFSPHLPRSVGGGGDDDDDARKPCDFEVRDDGVWGIGGDGDGVEGGRQRGDERRRRRRRRGRRERIGVHACSVN